MLHGITRARYGKDNMAISNIDFPSTTGGLELKISSIIDWIDAHVSRKRRSNERIDSDFCNRTIRRILEDGDTCYMNPCLDLTTVACAVLRANSIPPVLVVQEFGPTQKYSFNRLHSAIEFSNDGKDFFLDFNQLNMVLFGSGGYHNINRTSPISSFRITRNIGLDDNPRSFLSPQVSFANFDLTPQIARIKIDNTDDTYQSYLRAMRNDGRLYLERLRGGVVISRFRKA